MKVKELLKKVNSATVKQPVYIEDISSNKTARRAESTDFNGYYYEEEDRTVVDIEILSDKIVIFYK